MIEKRKIRYALLASVFALGIIGCGEIIDKVEDRPAPPANRGQYLDSNVSGLHYKATYGCHYVKDENSSDFKEVCEKSIEGTTYNGIFGFIPGGNGVKLSVAGLTLDYIPQKYLLRNSVLTVRETDGKLASFLQSMDSDANATNGINISKEVVKALRDVNVSKYEYIGNSELNVETLVQQVQEKLDANAPKKTPSNDNNETLPNEESPQKLQKPAITLKFVPEDKALEHLRNTISTHTTPPSITVEKVIDDVKDILDNAKEYSQEEIQEKVKALRTTLNNPLEGDRGLTDIEIAKALLDLSELTNEGYLEDIFDFRGSVESHLSQIIKEMALDSNTLDKKHIVVSKEENSTNVVANTKKAISSIVTKLQIISNKLGVSLATAPQYYRFKYDSIDISLDNIQALRSVLLATASKLSLTLAYNLGKDSDYIPKIYTDTNGNKYQYSYVDIHKDKLLNRDGFGVATNQSALTKAKSYLMQSAMILKDLDANLIREDLNETVTNTSEETNDNQEIIDYAKKLYKVLSDNNGTFTITDEQGGDNGEKEKYDIAINRLFDIKTAVSPSDFGTDWKYVCEDDFKIISEEERKINNEVICFNQYGYAYKADLEPTTKPESETSKLDELITKVIIGDSVVKTGQELIDYIVDIDSDSNKGEDSTPDTPTTPIHSRDKLLIKETRYNDDGTLDSATTYKYDSNNRISGYKITGSSNMTCTNSYDSKSRPTIVDCVDDNNTKSRTEFFYSGDRLSQVDYYSNGTLSMRESVIEWSGNKPKKIKRVTSGGDKYSETMTLTFNGKNPIRIDTVSNSNNIKYTTLKKYDTKKTPYDTVVDFGYYWWYGVNNVIEEKVITTYSYNGQTHTSETLTENRITYNSDLPIRVDTTIITDGNKAYQQKYYTIYEYKKAIK